MKTADINLPYFKQGDDLSHHLRHSTTVEDALESHAQQLEHAAEMLRKVKSLVHGQRVDIDADTHMIQISGPDDVIDKLLDAQLASLPPWEDVEDDDEDAGHAPSGWDRLF